ncbi:MAG: hypothetical protein J0M04_15625 [Verrucomicrobia bacterium]|nr:hypothetical protein [Verrucomicrobiota bacterium]
MKTLHAVTGALLALVFPLSAAPRLQVSTPSLCPESTLQFIFDLPVTPTTELGKPLPNTLVSIKPALPGKLVWKAQNIAELVPEHSPVMGASYDFSVSKNSHHLDGSEIPAGVFATAAAEGFELKSASTRNRWASDYEPATAPWQLVFNDEVSANSAAKYIAFFSKTGKRIQATLRTPTLEELGSNASYFPSWSERSRENPQTATADAPKKPDTTPVGTVLIATPASPLPPLGEWELIVVNGCPNKSGTAKQEKDSRHGIGKIDPFAVTSAGPRVSTVSPREIVIGFSQHLPDPLPKDFLPKCVTVTPRPAKLTVVRGDSSVTLRGDFSASDTYQLGIRPPFASSVGHPLEKAFSEKIVFEHLPAELVMPSRDQAQLANGTRAYRMRTVNLTNATVRIKQLDPAEALRTFKALRTQPPREKADEDSDGPPKPVILPFADLPGKPVFEQEFPLENAIDTANEINLDWNRVLPDKSRNAILFVEVTGAVQPALRKPASVTSQAIVQLTDIGLAWKLSAESAFIYAFSCTTGQPLPGVKLEVSGESGDLLAEAVTDASGCATVSRKSAARHLRATLGDDTYLSAFTCDDSLATVELWRFPVYQTWQDIPAAARQAFLFTDRSLYRPGETVRLKGIVRNLRGNTLEMDSPTSARMVVIDPTETEIHSQPVTISKSGSFDFTYKLPTTQTGIHLFRLEYPKELEKAEKSEDWNEKEQLRNYARFEHEVRVEDFRRNTFEVTQTIAPPAPAASKVDAAIDARYYQGQPVAAGKVAYQVHVSELNPYPERYRDFLFGNHRSEDWQYWYHYFGCRWDLDGESDEDGGGYSREDSSSQAETTLSADGKASMEIALPESAFPVGRSVVVTSETTDSNNQTLTAKATATVHPADVYVGVSRIDSLIRAGDPVPLKLVAVDPDGNPLKGDVKVTATLAREVNTSVKEQTPDGETTTQNQVREDAVSTADLTITAAASARDGQALTITPQATGRHFLTVRGKDAAGRAFATVTCFHVYGTKEYPWLYEDGLRVKLVAEKSSYQPGETARLLVLSPIEGTALVTVEREKVLRSFMVTLKADKPVIEVPITDDDAPYACVSVLIVKGLADSSRKFKEPQLRLGYCGLKVPNTRDRLKVELTATGPDSSLTKDISTFRPGGKVTFGGTVTFADGKPAANAEVTLYAEDEGTLAVMGYRTPDPMKHFHTVRYLQVATGTSFETFLAEDPEMQILSEKGYDVGGGGELGNLADLIRKNFDPCATWAPALTTDAQGRFSHTCTLPDTLTRYRVIAVAHHKASRFGNAESAVIANKPLMLEPKTPRFANQGDTISPRLLVQNASDYTGTWRITYRAHAATGSPVCRGLGEESQTVTLAPGASANLDFPSVLENTGEAVSEWHAEPVSLTNTQLTPVLARSLSDSVRARYPVHYPVPLLRENRFVKLDQPGAGRNLLENLDQSLLEGRGELELEFSTSPLADIGGSVDYLLHYPHGCAEQTTSSMMPWFAVEPLRTVIPAFAKVSKEQTAEAIQAGVDRLLTMQLANGSFSYWPAASDASDWTSSYAGIGLILAKESGARVPDAAIAKLANYLTERLRKMTFAKDVWEFDHHARDLWFLALAGKPQAAYQNTLRDRLGNLSPDGRAFLALAFAQSRKPADLATARSILASNKPIMVSDDWWMPFGTDNATKLLAWATIDVNAPETIALLDRLLNDRNPYGHWNNTWANGWGLLAITRYAKLEKTAQASANLTLQTPEGPQTITLDPKSPTAARTLALGPDLKAVLSNDQRAFVRLRLAAKPAIAPLKPVASNGMSIDRFYEKVNADGSVSTLTEPAVGDLVKVTLRVTLGSDDTRYIVIEDPLPAVFEAVNNDFASQRSMIAPGQGDGSWNVSHKELRDDRAVFYLDYVSAKGTYSISYLARCTLAGNAMAPPAKVESMYDPSKVALSASRNMGSVLAR